MILAAQITESLKRITTDSSDFPESLENHYLFSDSENLENLKITESLVIIMEITSKPLVIGRRKSLKERGPLGTSGNYEGGGVIIIHNTVL